MRVESTLSNAGSAKRRWLLGVEVLVLCALLAISFASASSATEPGLKFLPAWTSTSHDFAYAVAVRGEQAYIAGSFGVLRETPGCREQGGAAKARPNPGSKCSWAKVADGQGLAVLGIAFSPAGEGIAVGQSGLMLRAEGGSDDWQSVKLGIKRRLFAVTASSSGAFLVAGELGTLLYRPPGGQFAPVKTKWQGYSAPNFYGATFIGPDTALVVGEDGWVLTVKNGVLGDAISTARESLYSVTGCGDRYYSVGEQGLVESAHEGAAKNGATGITWRPSRVPGTPDLYSLACFDHNALVAVGAGALFRAASLTDNPVWQMVLPPVNARAPWYVDIVAVHSDPGALLAGPGGVWEVKLPNGK